MRDACNVFELSRRWRSCTCRGGGRGRPGPRPVGGSGRWPEGCTLVQRFDAVKFGIFQRKSSNFRELVLGCINADFCNQIIILQHFSRSKRFTDFWTARNSKNWETLPTFCWNFRWKIENLKIFWNFKIFSKFSAKLRNFWWNFEIRAAQNCENLVDLEKCCKMIIWL